MEQTRVSKAWSDKQLQRHKKAAAGLSVAGSGLALGALGAKGAAVGARRAMKMKAKSTGLRRFPEGRLKRVADQGDKQAINLSVLGGGVGAVGGFNFAGIQSAESKRVRKNYGGSMGMDYGLTGVHQHVPAETISKAGGALVRIPRTRQYRPTAEQVSSVPPRPPRNNRKRYIAGGVGAGAVGGLGAVAYDRKRHVSKRRDGWMNISEHEQRAKDSRRRRRTSDNVASVGVLGAGVSAGLASNRGRNVGAEAGNVVRSASSNFRQFKQAGDKKAALGRAKSSFGTSVKLNRYGAGALGGAALAVGATGASLGHGLNERHHTREIGRLRKKRTVSKAQSQPPATNGTLKPIQPTSVKPQVKPRPATTPVVPTKPAAKGATVSTYRSSGVSKAFDPERKRARRLEGYQAGLNAGAGALGVGAVASGRSAAQQIKWAKGKDSVSTKNLRSIARASGKAGALGLGTVGAAVAADRVGQYRKGRGRSYNALRG